MKALDKIRIRDACPDCPPGRQVHLVLKIPGHDTKRGTGFECSPAGEVGHRPPSEKRFHSRERIPN